MLVNALKVFIIFALCCWTFSNGFYWYGWGYVPPTYTYVRIPIYARLRTFQPGYTIYRCPNGASSVVYDSAPAYSGYSPYWPYKLSKC